MQAASAQELEPQRWRYLPVDTNFLTAIYIHTDADIALDPTLGLDDAEARLNTGVLAYLRTFELFGKSAQIRLLQPWQEGHWDGTLDGALISTERQGFADTEVRFAIDLIGAPPLGGEAYAAHRANTEAETIFGVALAVQLPTGDYNENKLINISNNQFVLRPEIGFVYDRQDWSFEASAMASFFTDNDSYFDSKQLERDPLYFVQANALYRFRPNLWAGAGVGYATGAETTVNSVGNDDTRENILWGLATGYSITPQIGVSFQFVQSHSRNLIGTDSNRYIVSLSTLW